MDIEISFTQQGSISIIKPLGKSLDASTNISFKKQTANWVSQGHAILLLDLNEVEFIDSSGLGSIISLFKLVADHGKMGICNTQNTVRSLFHLTRMDRVFPLYPNEAVGLSALTSTMNNK